MIPTDVASVFVFVDEGFPVEAVENVFTSFGIACHSTGIMLTQPKIIKPHYYTLRQSLTDIQPCRKVHVHSSMLNPLQSSVYALTVPFILISSFHQLSCKITMNPTLLPVDFKTQDFDTWFCCVYLWALYHCLWPLVDGSGLHALISTADLPVSSLYRSEKGVENIRIIIENKHINGLEINLECNNSIQPQVFGV